MQKGGNDAVVWVSPELEVAVLALENAKGYENLTVAIAKCKQFYVSVLFMIMLRKCSTETLDLT